MGGRLFIKIFIAFWFVTCAILGSWMLSADYFADLPGLSEQREPQPSRPPHRVILRTIYDMQNLELGDLKLALERLEKNHGLEAYIFQRDGTEVFGRSAPAQVRDVAGDLDRGKRRAFRDTPDGRILGHRIYRSDLGALRAVIQARKPKGVLLNLLGNSPLLRLAMAIVVSGVICFVLSRLVTNRLKVLQLASRRLANGELDTRLRVRAQGGDETDELARDFNSMAEQLQARIQAQKRLLGDVSHELRSPLARLRIALTLAQDDPAARENHLQRIEQEAERLEALIAQLLSSSAEDAVLDTHIDLVALLAQLCADAGFEGQPAGQTVSLSTALHEAVISSNGDLLIKCFENILRNALKHSPPGSDIRVTLDEVRDGDGIVYRTTVQDAGPGVPAQDLERIFDAFYRVETARTRETGGTGLGLSIARRAAEYHGGSISAANAAGGLCITVDLPLRT
ncbi:MAG: ATP-binding protein [Gammaproteobacteria bacterium]|nr:ATP-binding protein [Gammaproteobacteria bacterium]